MITICNYLNDATGRIIDMTRCDSSGSRAFPNTDVCKCSNGGDMNSDLRFWGNTDGRKKYNPVTGLVEDKPKLPWYNLWNMNAKLNRMSLQRYEEKMRSGDLPCHSK